MSILFGKETFEGGSLPANFDSVGTTWGLATATLDSNSKVNGVYSIKFSNTGEGGCRAVTTLDASLSEAYFQFSGFIPTGFAFGTSGYCGLFALFDGTDPDTARFNATIEDWGTIRLTLNGDVFGYHDTGIDLPVNSVFKLEVYVKKNASTGVVKVWLNNDTEGSPDYDSGSLNTGATVVKQFAFGKTYAPEATSDYYLDDFRIADAFIGASTDNYPYSTVFTWKGHTWRRRSGSGGPMYNQQWSKANVVGPDINDYMSVSITNPTSSSPYGCEFSSEQNGFGYGTYTCVVEGDLYNMYKSNVFGGMFTYSNNVEPHHNEIDAGETSAWGQNITPKVGHTYWRDDGLGNNEAVSSEIAVTEDTVFTHRMIWTPNSLVFDTFIGTGTGGTVLMHTVATANIPTPVDEKILFNTWVFNGVTNPDLATPITITIRDFTFSPYMSNRIEATLYGAIIYNEKLYNQGMVYVTLTLDLDDEVSFADTDIATLDKKLSEILVMLDEVALKFGVVRLDDILKLRAWAELKLIKAERWTPSSPSTAGSWTEDTPNTQNRWYNI